MSFFKTTWWRPASALIVLTLAVVALSVGGRGTALADTPDGSVTATPNPLQIGVGGSGQLSVGMTPAAAGTSIWIIQIAYDPAVAQVATDGTGNPVCTVLSVPSPFVGAGGCDTKDTNSDGKQDTLVIFGGVVQNDNGTAKGFTTAQTLATFTFDAAAGAAAGATTALTTTVTSFLGPTGVVSTPATPPGEIDIITAVGTSRIWGDGDCSGAVSPVDSLKTLKTDAGLAPTQTVAGCPAWGSNVTVNGITVKWGDVDCSGSVSPVDSLKVLKTDAGFPPVQTVANCPAMGSTVLVS